MTEADVRNAAMSKETEDEFRKMTYVQRVFLFVSIARNMYSVCNLNFKTWKKKQVSFHFESDTLSDHERTDWSRPKTLQSARRMHVWGQKLIQFEDENAKTLTLKSIMSETRSKTELSTPIAICAKWSSDTWEWQKSRCQWWDQI